MSSRRTPYVPVTILSFALALVLGLILVYRFIDRASLRRIDERLADVDHFVVTALEREYATNAEARTAVDRVITAMQAPMTT